MKYNIRVCLGDWCLSQIWWWFAIVSYICRQISNAWGKHNPGPGLSFPLHFFPILNPIFQVSYIFSAPYLFQSWCRLVIRWLHFIRLLTSNNHFPPPPPSPAPLAGFHRRTMLALLVLLPTTNTSSRGVFLLTSPLGLAGLKGDIENQAHWHQSNRLGSDFCLIDL